jgi:hypothetical protein
MTVAGSESFPSSRLAGREESIGLMASISMHQRARLQIGIIMLSALYSITFPLSTCNYMRFQQHSGFIAAFSTAVLCFQ